MKRFLASAWYPLLTCLVLAGVTVAAYAILKPTGGDVGNSEIVTVFMIGGWTTGPAIGLLSLLVIGILNLIRRLFRLRKVRLGHLIVILLGIGPWLVFSWTLLDEPRYTAFARAAIDFVGRPMLWGSLAATLFALLLSIPLFLSSKK